MSSIRVNFLWLLQSEAPNYQESKVDHLKFALTSSKQIARQVFATVLDEVFQGLWSREDWVRIGHSYTVIQ